MAGTKRKRVKFHNISLYFGIDVRQTGENGYGKGQEAGVKGTGSGSKRYLRWVFRAPCLPPHNSSILILVLHVRSYYYFLIRYFN